MCRWCFCPIFTICFICIVYLCTFVLYRMFICFMYKIYTPLIDRWDSPLRSLGDLFLRRRALTKSVSLHCLVETKGESSCWMFNDINNSTSEHHSQSCCKPSEKTSALLASGQTSLGFQPIDVVCKSVYLMTIPVYILCISHAIDPPNRIPSLGYILWIFQQFVGLFVVYPV